MNTTPIVEEIELDTPYLRLAAQVSGPKNGRRVLALHGWLDNAASFARVAPLLTEVRLVSLDLAGHGLSEHRPAGINYYFLDYIPDVLAAADVLGWDEFALLGHSMGAGVASFVAAIAPKRITRLALIEGLGPMSADPADNPAALETAIQQMKRLGKKRLPVYAELADAIRARQNASGLSWLAATVLTGRSTKLTPQGVTWRSDPRLTFKSPLYLSETQVLAYLAHIQAPTLLIRARTGNLIDRDGIAERYARVKHLTVTTLPGGHHLHLEEPHAIARILQPFFASQ